MPTDSETWNAKPIPTPSMKLCPINAKRGEHPDVRMVMDAVIRFVRVMDEYELLKAVEEQKPDDQCDHMPL
jgi:hypothetical protein